MFQFELNNIENLQINEPHDGGYRKEVVFTTGAGAGLTTFDLSTPKSFTNDLGNTFQLSYKWIQISLSVDASGTDGNISFYIETPSGAVIEHPSTPRIVESAAGDVWFFLHYREPSIQQDGAFKLYITSPTVRTVDIVPAPGEAKIILGYELQDPITSTNRIWALRSYHRNDDGSITEYDIAPYIDVTSLSLTLPGRPSRSAWELTFITRGEKFNIDFYDQIVFSRYESSGTGRGGISIDSSGNAIQDYSENRDGVPAPLQRGPQFSGFVVGIERSSIGIPYAEPQMIEYGGESLQNEKWRITIATPIFALQNIRFGHNPTRAGKPIVKLNTTQTPKERLAEIVAMAEDELDAAGGIDNYPSPTDVFGGVGPVRPIRSNFNFIEENNFQMESGPFDQVIDGATLYDAIIETAQYGQIDLSIDAAGRLIAHDAVIGPRKIFAVIYDGLPYHRMAVTNEPGDILTDCRFYEYLPVREANLTFNVEDIAQKVDVVYSNGRKYISTFKEYEPANDTIAFASRWYRKSDRLTPKTEVEADLINEIIGTSDQLIASMNANEGGKIVEWTLTAKNEAGGTRTLFFEARNDRAGVSFAINPSGTVFTAGQTKNLSFEVSPESIGENAEYGGIELQNATVWKLYVRADQAGSQFDLTDITTVWTPPTSLQKTYTYDPATNTTTELIVAGMVPQDSVIATDVLTKKKARSLSNIEFSRRGKVDVRGTVTVPYEPYLKPGHMIRVAQMAHRREPDPITPDAMAGSPSSDLIDVPIQEVRLIWEPYENVARRVTVVHNHTQTTASSVWTIEHEITSMPSAVAYDDSEPEVEIFPTEIRYPRPGVVELEFATAQAGRAVLRDLQTRINDPVWAELTIGADPYDPPSLPRNARPPSGKKNNSSSKAAIQNNYDGARYYAVGYDPVVSSGGMIVNIMVHFDGNGSAIDGGQVVDIPMAFGGLVVAWTATAIGVSGGNGVYFNVRRTSQASYPGGFTNMSSGQTIYTNDNDSTHDEADGWADYDFEAGDIVRISLTNVPTATRASIALFVRRA